MCLFSGFESTTPRCLTMISWIHAQYFWVFLQSMYKNSYSSDSSPDILATFISTTVLAMSLGSQSIRISLRRGLSWVMIACSTTVLKDSVLLGLKARVGKECDCWVGLRADMVLLFWRA